MRFCQHCGKQIDEEFVFCPLCGGKQDDLSSEIGKTCPYCQAVIKPGVPVTVCPECGMPHHRECWEANGSHCTTFGCSANRAANSVSERSQERRNAASPGTGQYYSEATEPVIKHYEVKRPIGAFAFCITAPANGVLETVAETGRHLVAGVAIFALSYRNAEGLAVRVLVRGDCGGIVEEVYVGIGNEVEVGTQVLLFRPEAAPQASIAQIHPITEDGVSIDEKNPNKWKRWLVVAALVIATGVSVYLNGSMTWTSSDGTYTGQVRWGTRHGLGALIAPDGTRYTSNWVDGFAVGPGELVLPDGRKFTGTFDLANKKAKVQLADGSRYEGDFEHNNFNGLGKMIRPNGAEYNGNFRDGKKDGTGNILLPDGTKFEGEFRNDNLHGRVEITNKDGEIIRGEFSNGKQDGVFKRFPPNRSDEAGLMFESFWRNGNQIETERVKAPLAVSNLRVRNSAHGEVINDWNTRFRKQLIRYIHFEGILNSESPHGISGELLVRYIEPNGNIKRNPNISPYGGTFSQKFSGNGSVGSGWGNPDVSTYAYGRHYIQLLWKGIQVGEAYFDVY